MRFAERWRRLRGQMQRRLSQHSALLVLQRRNLYILPSGFGGLWLAVIGVLYVVGINSRSNGPVLLSQLLLALQLLSLVLTHRNLEGLELQALESEPCYADAPAQLSLLARSERPRSPIQFSWLPTGTKTPLSSGAVAPSLAAGSSVVQLEWMPPGRGLHRPGRLLIQTTAPLGLFVCWSYWEPPITLTVAPARRAGPVEELKQPQQQQAGQALRGGSGSDDFQELSPLRPQEGLQRVAWKTAARGQGLYAKRFAAEQQAERWLAPAPGLPPEQALEHLCERLQRGLQAGEALGLALPAGPDLPPGRGLRHLNRCLEALAAAPPQPPA